LGPPLDALGTVFLVEVIHDCFFLVFRPARDQSLLAGVCCYFPKMSLLLKISLESYVQTEGRGAILSVKSGNQSKGRKGNRWNGPLLGVRICSW